MASIFSAPIEWLMRHRSSLPQWVNRLMVSVARNPDGLVGRVASKLLGTEAPSATVVPDTPVRVYLAPTNYAGQAYQWARALERADPRIGARNLAVTLPGGYSFPADTSVPIAVVNGSAEWAQAEWDAARRFTHVLVEAERSMFGRRFGRRLEDEILALEAAGVSVAYLSHGTDIRDPARHALRTPWSPYPEDPRTALLQSDAEANLDLMTRLRRPTFISTPDLLADLPWATWCPVVVDAAAFATDEPPFSGERVRLVHASSAAVQKGTALIEPALESLTRSGAAEVRLVSGAASGDMPAVFADADIVLDQFRLGSYGVAACEAMAAGRLVIGHVLPDVRRHIEDAQGVALPIVEATPDTLARTVEDLLQDSAGARRIAAAGPDFVARVHSGAASAQALLRDWISAP